MAASPLETRIAMLVSPELQIEHMTLYHGSATSGIAELKEAQETTVGTGVYFVDNIAQASEYAIYRARNRGGTPVVYEAAINNIKLVNLLNQGKLSAVMSGFRGRLLRELQVVPENAPWHKTSFLHRRITEIEKGIEVGMVRNATLNHSGLFSDYLGGIGYDGLMTWEGGEDNIGSHVTYLIFKPESARVTKEQTVTQALGSRALA